MNSTTHKGVGRRLGLGTAALVSLLGVGVLGFGTTAAQALPTNTSRPIPLPTIVPCSSVPAPTITSASPSLAAPGTTEVVNGTNFGATPGYVTFSDDGVQWGAPGNLATFNVVHWSNTQVTFQVPYPSGGGAWGTVGDTVATVSVTDSCGLQSNTANVTMETLVHWPISLDATTNVAGGQWVNTAAAINSDGQMTVSTDVWDTDCPTLFGIDLPFLTGFHGASVITLKDQFGNTLGQWTFGPYGVEGCGSANAPTTEPTQTEQLTQDQILAAYSVSLNNFSDPQFSAPGTILAWIESNAAAIAAAATAIAAAV
jgi:hypothetical protein